MIAPVAVWAAICVSLATVLIFTWGSPGRAATSGDYLDAPHGWYAPCTVTHRVPPLYDEWDCGDGPPPRDDGGGTPALWPVR